MRTIDWVDGGVRLIDQTLLPTEERFLSLQSVEELAEAITSLRVRGAPALGVAGGLGVALAAHRARESGEDVGAAVARAAELLAATRPTAVNLKWGIDRARAAYEEARPGTPDETVEALVSAATAMVEEDERLNFVLGEVGARLIPADARLLTHCNAGALACVAHGTALGVISAAHRRGSVAKVTATETRPLLQGSRLTAWELKRLGVPHRITIDSAAAGIIAAGEIDAVVTGADRIAANGDVANKVGTYSHALAAAAHGIPFIVAAPTSTIDLDTPDGGHIPIEERDPGEVLRIGGARIAPEGTEAYNPAFDITPAHLVTAIVTELGVVRPGEDDLRTQLRPAGRYSTASLAVEE